MLLTSDMRAEINRVRLMAGLPYLDPPVSGQMDSQSPEQDACTLRAFLHLEKMQRMARADVVLDSALENIPLPKRALRRLQQASERLKVAPYVDDYSDRSALHGDSTRPSLYDVRESRHLQRYYRVFGDDNELRFIVLSNTPFVPGLPPSRKQPVLERIDGRRGFHEETLYPQMHKPARWHMPFVPALTSRHSDLAADIAWYEADFETDFERVGDGFCMLWRVSDDLRCVIEDARRWAIHDWIRPRLGQAGAPFSAKQALNRAADHLIGHAMSEIEARQTIAEFQRSLLELRGWTQYNNALATHQRMASKLNRDWLSVLNPAAQGQVDPHIRGVFVSDSETSRVYGHFGVPTWWIRRYSEILLGELRSRNYTEVGPHPYRIPPELEVIHVDRVPTFLDSFDPPPAFNVDVDDENGDFADLTGFDESGMLNFISGFGFHALMQS